VILIDWFTYAKEKIRKAVNKQYTGFLFDLKSRFVGCSTAQLPSLHLL